MLKLWRRAARSGIVTTSYPDVPEAAPPAYRGQVLLLADRCASEAACARACPSEAITVTPGADSGWTWELDDARCVVCGLCAEACPSEALLISNEFELAVRHRSDLATRVTFGTEPADNGKERL